MQLSRHSPSTPSSSSSFTAIRRPSSDSRKQSSSLAPWQRATAAGTGALCQALFMTPLDVVRVRQQSAVSGGTTRKTPQYATNIRGTLLALYRIPRTEGLRSMWSGLTPGLALSLPGTIAFFSIYDPLLERLRQHYGHDAFLPPAVAGVLTRSALVTLAAPLETMRTKMQSEQMQWSQISAAVRSAWNSHGIRGLCLGLAPTLVRDVPFTAIYWSGYEAMKGSLLELRGAETGDFTSSFVAGASLGTLAAVVTNPIDVIKTQRQIELGRGETGIRRPSMWAMFVRLRSDGGLWAGVAPRVMKVAPACAITIATYEYAKGQFARANGASF